MRLGIFLCSVEENLDHPDFRLMKVLCLVNVF